MTTRFLFLSVLIGAMPLTMAAQDDDLYFTPKKSSKAEMSARHDRESYDRPTYYCGSNRNVDEYNRRGKLKSYYQKIGTDSLGNDIIEFREGDGTYGKADLDSTITIYPGSERYYDDDDSDFAYSRRMGRFDGFYGYWDPAFYGTYWGSPYWRGYYGWYDPWYDPWYYGSYYSGWYGGWYNPWYYGYYGWGGWPYYGWGGWYAPGHYAYSGPTGTRNHSAFGSGTTAGNRTFGSRGSFGSSTNRNGGTGSRWFGNRDNSSTYQQNNNGFGRRNSNNTYQQNRDYQQRQAPTYSNPNSGFGSSRGTFGGGAGFGGSRGSFGGGGGFGGGSRGGGGGFGSRR